MATCHRRVFGPYRMHHKFGFPNAFLWPTWILNLPAIVPLSASYYTAAHCVRTMATISGQTPVHPKMYLHKQPIQPQKILVACTPPVFLGFTNVIYHCSSTLERVPSVLDHEVNASK